jgi:RNA polymerase sigma factor (sigma-70 family)
MNEKADAQLLHDYASHGDEEAFRELVSRHAGVIYSAALRQVGSPDLARDVAQSVFTDLARKAASLSRERRETPSLLGWLYQGARFAALRQLRDDRRRLARERLAMENLDPAPDSPAEWERLSPLLDEAMSDLSDDDREALLLRYFSNLDFRTIGQSLGVSDDAAQKRVSRALDRLRAGFAQRGLATSAVALASVLSANAAGAAPAGLAAALSSAAISANALAAGSAAATTTVTAKVFAMTTLQKTLIAAALAAVAGTGIYEARRASALNEEVARLRQQESSAASPQLLAQLEAERDAATNQVAALLEQLALAQKNSGELPKLRREVSELRSASAAASANSNDPVQAAAKSWADRVAALKQRLAQTPGASIPEMKALTEANWLNATRDPLSTDKDYRKAFAALRSAAENQFIIDMQSAVSKYVKENGGQFPTDVMQLKSFFEKGADDAALQRYGIVPASSIPNMKMGGDWLITVKDPIDPEYDTMWSLGPNGFGSSNYSNSKNIAALGPALKAYAAANNGAEPKKPEDILPYLKTPEELAAFERLNKSRLGK